jgi:hypothetical protein
MVVQYVGLPDTQEQLDEILDFPPSERGYPVYICLMAWAILEIARSQARGCCQR